ncbi:predicted protein [Plenodomus lingam JN3]|uniref:Predicted protein n=1 Tax=Leptosphaeria maculans (strain JN3 / isolate v23.1.3 / race Av1-4-5-6-7-8) TaxID=985895 RepID=E4ZM55_LEPMJ|nr:predicted protein [Plenodomus lingam JN3]CBX92404.1 predicted protein [Plenodomus lingam JN3]
MAIQEPAPQKHSACNASRAAILHLLQRLKPSGFLRKATDCCLQYPGRRGRQVPSGVSNSGSTVDNPVSLCHETACYTWSFMKPLFSIFDNPASTNSHVLTLVHQLTALTLHRHPTALDMGLEHKALPGPDPNRDRAIRIGYLG